MGADASTEAANPAGMTLLDRTQLMAAAGVLLPFTNFDKGPGTTTSGGSGGNAGVFFPLGSFFYAYKYSERLSFGMGTYSNFGLSANYGNSWAGRYYVNRESLITMQGNPSVAYQLTKWLSVGVGGSFSVGRLTFKSQIRNLLPGIGDGSYSFESWDEAFGGDVGAMLTPIDKLHIGLTYQSPFFFKFGFNPFFQNLAGCGKTSIP